MKTKNELIEEVLRLDGERTQGEWYRNIAPVTGKICITSDEAWICGQLSNGNGEFDGEGDKNAAFIALAPQMASLIRDLKAQRDMAVEALEQVERYYNFTGMDKPKHVNLCRDALAKIKGELQ